MSHLKDAHRELFRRQPDECFSSLTALWQRCHEQKEQSLELWESPDKLRMQPVSFDRLLLTAGDDGAFQLTDWSFGQLCRLSGVSKETVNRLTPDTAAKVFAETLPTETRPLQLLTMNDRVRSIHGTAYTRLYNVDLLTVVREFATDFEAPPKGLNGGTGLYAGEQDMFCFMIDPTGWTEIGGESFAPGFYLWNSEVGRRSLGLSTFWFQAVCGNHIVWDAIEVNDLRRKHTANIHDGLREVRRMIEDLVRLRDERRDGFTRVIKAAMTTTLGDDADEVAKALSKSGIRRKLAAKAIELATKKGSFSVFTLMDALTRLSQERAHVGERLEVDQSAAALLNAVA